MYESRQVKDLEVGSLRAEYTDEICKLKSQIDDLTNDRDALEMDNTQLREKNESIQQWESQVTEIIQW